MTELGKAYVQLMPSAKGIKGMIEKELGSEIPQAGDSAGRSLGSTLVKTLTGVISAAAIGKTIGAALSEGAALQQSIGGIETLFKDSADTVIKYANDAYKTAGLSANEYMEQTTSFAASLLQSTAGDTEAAAEIANMAMIDMADNANKMGTNMQDIQNAYQGFAKQNYTMLDNLKLGYGGTKTEMERLLKDAEALTGIEYNIDNLADVYEAIHVIQEELDITGTTAKEAAETFSGSFASMRSAAKNLLGQIALGADITPSLMALAETTATFLFGNFLPMIGNILSAVPQLISTFITAALPYLANAGMNMLQSLATGFNGDLSSLNTTVLNTINNITSWITENLPSLLQSGVSMLLEIANGILQSIPSLIATAGDIVTNLVTFIMDNLPTILQSGIDLLGGLISGIIENLPAIATAAFDVVTKFVGAIAERAPDFLAAGFSVIYNIVDGVTEKLPEIVSTAIEIVTNFINTISEKLPDIISAGRAIIHSLISGIKELVSKVVEQFKTLGSNIIAEVKSINLWEAGKSIMNSLLNGLKEAWSGVTNFVGGIGTWIQENKGPVRYDRKLLIPAGKAIMFGLIEGLTSQFGPLQNEVLSIAEMISNGLSNIELDQDLLNQEVILKRIYVDEGLNSLDLAKENMQLTNGILFNQNLSNDDTEILEALSLVVDRLDNLGNKELASYLDQKKVSRELDNPLRQYQETQKMTYNRMRGDYA